MFDGRLRDKRLFGGDFPVEDSHLQRIQSITRVPVGKSRNHAQRAFRDIHIQIPESGRRGKSVAEQVKQVVL